ncbi:MAG: hypothetical protein A2931_04550 [Candidatus Niyogibacteria bacterium RIFCSPLOWO2_01_FULL_45_48]|uniref:Uncharacterized protein n=2 Tax=Parcubacteria group TaxID=1794811 RepID=A0A1G2R8L8_9BACT|nr:MAG: hypothetical protein A2835_01120 [Candidatus Niyogibacteria bacterium RIFCSPHIGHO2_01_FULL_45_28]OGZ30253.1 MAG: hypothetical protein A2931_04550 [Candidatus Niyogibacteria bacterium RIFCSPLOWO2_01_FULL_45_48]OHA68612.1 MAG: hypothetical protein A3D59_00605 [Candidatus Wildermuthbacteria bacterium RIFCSPHIGHO2_02_FULL_47_17]OHA75893.1 MAG: hypothetical protein A3I38_02905 [Candidatus Wildermuthbacteria bacterium RIFCSPLOWO2_02_FULL_47_10]
MTDNLKEAVFLKERWMQISPRFFEPLTLNELPVGSKFIVLPEPGDNSGHGGFKKAHYIFIKTSDSHTDGVLPAHTPQVKAINLQNGCSSIFSSTMFVIHVL